MRSVTMLGNERVWPLVGKGLPPLPSGRTRDPYWEQGSHPDVVERVWDELGKALPVDSRAQANGTPVLAHPRTDRIFAASHGTAYLLWLIPEDYLDALKEGASTSMRWSGGSTTDLLAVVGEGWIWGGWHRDEPEWVRRAYEAASG